MTNADDDSAKVEQVHDSPTGWVAAHVRRYVDSGGTKGHRWNGLDTLLITTRGRRTGQLRRTALIYRRNRGGYIVVAWGLLVWRGRAVVRCARPHSDGRREAAAVGSDGRNLSPV